MSQPQVGTKFEDLFAGTIDQTTGNRTRVPDDVCKKLDKLTLISSKDRALRNDYKRAYSSLRSALDGFKEFSDEKAFAKDSKDLVDAYQNYYKVSMEMATKFNGGGAKKNEISGLVGRDLQNFEVNRGFISNATNMGIDKIRSVANINNLGNNEKIFTFTDLMKKADMIEFKKEGSTSLGDGQVNEVSMFKDGDTSYVSKKGGKNKTIDNTNNETIESSMYEKIGHLTEEERLGKNLGRNRREAAVPKTMKVENALRDQGQNTVNKLLGYNVITNTRVGVDAEKGLTSVMDLAKGAKACDVLGYVENESKTKLDGYIDKMKNEPEFKDFINNTNKKYLSDIDKQPIFDMKDPSFQKACQELALVDLISGQLDRHQGNFFISGEKGNVKITGIDNDYSFGMYSLNDIQTGKVYGGSMPNVTKLNESFPFMTEDMAKKIDSLDPKMFSNALAGSVGMSDGGEQRLKAVEGRVQEIKDYLNENRSKEGFIVKGYDDKTAEILRDKGRDKVGREVSPFAKVSTNLHTGKSFDMQAGELDRLNTLSEKYEKEKNAKKEIKSDEPAKDEAKKDDIKKEDVSNEFNGKGSLPPRYTVRKKEPGKVKENEAPAKKDEKPANKKDKAPAKPNKPGISVKMKGKEVDFNNVNQGKSEAKEAPKGRER